jgi:cation diffusion facilitator family transporter
MANQSKVVKAVSHDELPVAMQVVFRKATRLEWITVYYIISVVIVMFLAMQSSQAMKAAWLEDVLSIFPSLSFLVAGRFFNREPNARFPFGYHRTFSIAFQIGAFTLLTLGLYVFYDSITTLLKAERASIGSIFIAGKQVWHGWVMIAALIWSCIPSVILGMKKLPLCKKLHNKILFTDAQTQKADWQTAVAAIAGIIGVGFGLWWADAAAACFISVSIVMEGWTRLKGAVQDLIDQVPTDIENKKTHPLVNKLHKLFKDQPWVKDVRLRMREAGEVFFTEAFVIPNTTTNLLENIAESTRLAQDLDWKIYDVVVTPVKEFTMSEDEGN